MMPSVSRTSGGEAAKRAAGIQAPLRASPAAEAAEFKDRLAVLVGGETMEKYAIKDLFANPQMTVTAPQLLIDFCEFNKHAASNVLKLSADIMDNATHAPHPSFRAFGASTSAIAALVLRAATDDELGTAAHNFMDTHDVLMSFMLEILREQDPTLIARGNAAISLLESDRLYRGAAATGSLTETICYRLGVHLASEYSASEEFAAMTHLLQQRFPQVERRLRASTHPQWAKIDGCTWISCHEEVEIGHARFALQAAALALKHDVSDVSLEQRAAVLQKGFADFYKLRKTFFEELLATTPDRD